jgi:hypothetical protein
MGETSELDGDFDELSERAADRMRQNAMNG